MGHMMRIQVQQLKVTEGEKVLCYCSVVMDDLFVVHDIKLLKDFAGRTFLAMPTRQLRDCCLKCHGKNCLRARFCNWCGKPLRDDRAELDENNRPKLYADVAHPISVGFRERMEDEVVRAYKSAGKPNGNPQ